MSAPSQTMSTEEGELSNEARMEEWVKAYGRPVLYGLVIAGLVIALVFQLSRGQRLKAEGDYLTAESQFDRFAQADPEGAVAQEAFAELREILERRPHLRPRYEGRIAQVFLAEGMASEAQGYAEAVLERHKIPLYSDYAVTSLTIADGKYQPALSDSLALQSKLEGSSDQGSLLLSNFVAMRIFTLQQVLGEREAELASVERLIASLDKATSPEALIDNDPAIRATQEFVTLFRAGRVNLIDYLRARQKELS